MSNRTYRGIDRNLFLEHQQQKNHEIASTFFEVDPLSFVFEWKHDFYRAVSLVKAPHCMVLYSACVAGDHTSRNSR